MRHNYTLVYLLYTIISFSYCDTVFAETQASPEKAYPPYTAPGFDGVQAEPTGYFYTKQIGDAWWIIDPSGKGYYAVGIGHVSYSGENCERLGYAPYNVAVQKKYASRAAWGDATVQRFKEWGFNTLGELNDHDVLAHKYPSHTVFQCFGYVFAQRDGLPTPKEGVFAVFPNVFSPEWPKFCDDLARETCAPWKDDPWMLGYFVDNELTWGGAIGAKWGLFDAAWQKPAADPAKQAWLDFLKSRLSSASEFAANWGTEQASWEELAQSQQPFPPMTPLAYEICNGWLKLVADRYFREVAASVRRHDPNHMILGVRFTTDVPDILDVVGQYCDAVTINYYPQMEPGKPLNQYNIDLLAKWHQQAGKPILISEWSFPSFDSGLPSTIGAGMRVETQQQRAECWAAYQETLFKMPFIVGSNYFMWTDEPAWGISSNHRENTNYGLVDENDQPYLALVEKAKAINPQVYELHAKGEMPQGNAPRELAGCVKEFEPMQPANENDFSPADGLLQIKRESGSAEWLLSVKDQFLCTIKPRIVQHYKGYKWSVPSDAKIMQTLGNDLVIAIELELSNDSSAAKNMEGRYRSVWRFFAPRKNPDWFGMQCLSVENTGDAAWRLPEVECLVESNIGRNDTQDAPFGLSHKWTPFYKNGSFLWDQAAGLGIGATFLNPMDYAHYFFADKENRGTAILRHKTDVTLAPGESYSQAAPAVFFFPMQYDSAAHFARNVEKLMRQAAE